MFKKKLFIVLLPLSFASFLSADDFAQNRRLIDEAAEIIKESQEYIKENTPALENKPESFFSGLFSKISFTKPAFSRPSWLKAPEVLENAFDELSENQKLGVKIAVGLGVCAGVYGIYRFFKVEEEVSKPKTRKPAFDYGSPNPAPASISNEDSQTWDELLAQDSISKGHLVSIKSSLSDFNNLDFWMNLEPFLFRQDFSNYKNFKAYISFMLDLHKGENTDVAKEKLGCRTAEEALKNLKQKL